MKKFLGIILISVSFMFNLAAQQKDFQVMLLQSNDVLGERCPDVQDFVGYIKEIQNELSKVSFKSEGFIILAVRPFYKSNVWFDFKNEDSNKLNELKEKILAIDPCYAQGGAIVFALTNYEHPETAKVLPDEWKEAFDKKQGKEFQIADIVDEVWPPEITSEEKAYLLAVIEAFKNETDFSDESLSKYSMLSTLAVSSDLFKMTVSNKYWPEEVSSNKKYGTMFLLAYIAGNMEQQLITGKYEDSPKEGLNMELYKYKQIKEQDKKFKIKFFESKLKK